MSVSRTHAMFAPVIIFTIPLLIKQVNCRSVMARHNHIAVHSQIPVTNGFSDQHHKSQLRQALLTAFQWTKMSP